MKWRFREGKLENFVHESSTWLLECYQFALCGLSSFLKLPISDAVWIRVSESQFRNSELLSLMANVHFLSNFYVKGAGWKSH